MMSDTQKMSHASIGACVERTLKALERIPDNHPVRDLGLSNEGLQDAYEQGGVRALMECCQQTTTAAAHLWERSDLDALDWREFEQLVAMLYESRGCDTRLTDDGADGGVDIYVRCSGRLKAVEVKHRTSGGTVGRPVVQKTASHLLRQPVLQAVVVSSGQFSSDALSYVAGTDANITLVSGKDVLAAASINGLPKGGNS